MLIDIKVAFPSCPPKYWDPQWHVAWCIMSRWANMPVPEEPAFPYNVWAAATNETLLLWHLHRAELHREVFEALVDELRYRDLVLHV